MSARHACGPHVPMACRRNCVCDLPLLHLGKQKQNIHNKEMEDGDDKRLLNAAAALRDDARTMQSKLTTHNLLIEAIEATNAGNARAMGEGYYRLRSAAKRIREDPRNRVILVLILVLLLMSLYLLAF